LQLGIFTELQGNLKEILRAVGAIVEAHKKGRGVASNTGMKTLYTYNIPSEHYPSEIAILEANPNKSVIF
jgi:hypothetical protein